MIKTGVPQLDGLLGGGIKEKTRTVVWVKPGLNGIPFAAQIASSASKSNDVLYIVNSKDPSSLKAEIKKFGISAGKIKFVDAYSKLIGVESNEALVVSNPKDVEVFAEEVSKFASKLKNPLVIIDSLSNLFDLMDDETGKSLDALKKIKGTHLYLFTEWDYKSALLNTLKKGSDNIVNVSSVERKIFNRNFFGVTKSSLGTKGKQAIPYKLTTEGIKIYVPKILVTGPFNAGKTSFIHSASEKSVSVDRLGTTIALDHGHATYGDFSVDLFGTPGQERFDPILKLLGGEALGVIVVVSSVDREGFGRAADMIKKSGTLNMPYLVVANKSNLRGALSPKQIRELMNLPKEVEVIPVSAKDLTRVQPGLPCALKSEDIDKVLSTLFEKLLEGGLK